MKSRLFWVLIMMAPILMYSQSYSSFDRIHGITSDGEIFLRWNEKNKSFEYAVVSLDSWYLLDEDVLFNVKNQHKNNISIYLQFYNPLKYSITSELQDVDDASIKAIGEFLGNLPVSSDGLSGGTLLPSLVPGSSAVNDPLESIVLHDWLYQFSLAIDQAAILADVTTFNQLTTALNNVQILDKFLFGEFVMIIPGSAPERSLNNWVKTSMHELTEADDYEKFTNALETAKEIQDKLTKYDENAKSALKNIQTLLTSDFDTKIAPFIAASKKAAFKKYSSSTSNWLKMRFQKDLDINKGIIDEFKKQVAALDEFVVKFDFQKKNSADKTLHFYKSQTFNLTRESEKLKVLTYKTSSLNNTEEKAGAISGSKFAVAKKLTFYPFISTGLIYTDFSYPNYTISENNGINLVGRADDLKVFVRPSVFLNFLLADWEVVYPLFQIGITTGVKDALFPVGIGLTFGESFSMTGGLMIGYYKDLNTLKIGEEVQDQTQLENDLTYRGAASWYISINYNLGK